MFKFLKITFFSSKRLQSKTDAEISRLLKSLEIAMGLPARIFSGRKIGVHPDTRNMVCSSLKQATRIEAFMDVVDHGSGGTDGYLLVRFTLFKKNIKKPFSVLIFFVYTNGNVCFQCMQSTL